MNERRLFSKNVLDGFTTLNTKSKVFMVDFIRSVQNDHGDRDEIRTRIKALAAYGFTHEQNMDILIRMTADVRFESKPHIWGLSMVTYDRSVSSAKGLKKYDAWVWRMLAVHALYRRCAALDPSDLAWIGAQSEAELAFDLMCLIALPGLSNGPKITVVEALYGQFIERAEQFLYESKQKLQPGRLRVLGY